jgi:hypothetical protein
MTKIPYTTRRMLALCLRKRLLEKVRKKQLPIWSKNLVKPGIATVNETEPNRSGEGDRDQ